MTDDELLRELVPHLDEVIKHNPDLIREFRKRIENSEFKPWKYLLGCM